MQDKRELNILITATAKGVREATRQAERAIQSGFEKGRRAVKAFNDTVGNGQKAVSLLSGSVKTLLAGVVGFTAIRKATDIMKDADQAAFSMQTSVAAANREFANVGTVKDWEGTIHKLSNELRIYSDTALKKAVSRTVDMTKRLGLSKTQMEEVIKRAADLGAGKVELEGSIERVTAALRGEAESAEYLGLTLNENYVKGVYEADQANKKAWKSLTDLEKAQARYAVFLQQSEQLQGRAAQSADTFSGTLSEIRKEIENAVSNSKDLNTAMQKVATVLRRNSGQIGDIIALLVTAAARVIEFVVAWKGLIVALVGTAAGIAVVSKLVAIVKGLHAAFVVLTGMGLVQWFGSLRQGINAAAASTSALSLAFKGFIALAAAQGILNIGRLVKVMYEWRQAVKTAQKAQANLAENTSRLMRKYEEFKDIKLPDDLTKLTQEDLKRLQKELNAARTYWFALKFDLEEKAEEKTFLGTATDEALEAQKKLQEVNQRLQAIQADYKKVGDAATGAAQEMAKPIQAVMATKEQLDEFEKKARTAYDEAKKLAADYAKQVIGWEEKIKYARLSTEDKIRELERKGLEDAEVWADKKLQAEEKVAAAKEALAKKDFALAEKLAQDARALYADLAVEVKGTQAGGEVVLQALEDTKQVAIDGVTEVGNFIEELYTVQKDAAAKARDEWSATAEGIQKQLDEIAKQREANVKITLTGLEKAQVAINRLTKDETKHITVVTHNVEARQSGGVAGVLARTGRLLSGYGGGDRIRALLEAGEFVVRKEAVKKYGAGLFHALNAMKINLSDAVRARIGGLVANLSLPAASAPPLALQTGGMAASVPTESMTIRFQAGNVEMPLQVTGDPQVTRAMVQAFEKELVKMGMSRR